jgi:hypothetical protein
MLRSLMFRSACGAALAAAAFSSAALAHHGFGRFNMSELQDYTGTLTRVDFVNPHTYMYFDSVDADGNPLAMKCELRAATLLKRSGWDENMFVVGAEVHLKGHPHREDPTSCYVEDLQIGDVTVNRNDQFDVAAVDTSNRPYRLASGEVNITGDWAVEQLVLTVPPSGGNGAMIPKSLRDGYASGELSLEQINELRPRSRTEVDYTDAGEAAVQAFRSRPINDNPRTSCDTISFIYDWNWDWPVNQITQYDDRIEMRFGLYAHHRTIHMDRDAHPADIEPSAEGDSIGHWEGDTLVVDTVGFKEGYISPPTPISEQGHIVERYTLDPETLALTRSYEATDPVYFTSFSGSDVSYLSDVPFEEHPCMDLTPEVADAEVAEASQEARAAEAAANIAPDVPDVPGGR